MIKKDPYRKKTEEDIPRVDQFHEEDMHELEFFVDPQYIDHAQEWHQYDLDNDKRRASFKEPEIVEKVAVTEQEERLEVDEAF